MYLIFPIWAKDFEEGTILEWHVKVGDKVKVGDPLVQMETDKVADIPPRRMGSLPPRQTGRCDSGAPLQK